MLYEREHVRIYVSCLLFATRQLATASRPANHQPEILVLLKIQGQTEVGKIPQKSTQNFSSHAWKSTTDIFSWWRRTVCLNWYATWLIHLRQLANHTSVVVNLWWTQGSYGAWEMHLPCTQLLYPPATETKVVAYGGPKVLMDLGKCIYCVALDSGILDPWRRSWGVSFDVFFFL